MGLVTLNIIYGHKLMKLKSVIRVMIFGISVGFIFGLVRAIQLISSHRYFRYELHHLILSELTENINRGTVYSLMVVIFSILIISAVSFIWRKLFSPFFEVRITQKKKLNPLFKGFSFSLILAYLNTFASKKVCHKSVPLSLIGAIKKSLTLAIF